MGLGADWVLLAGVLMLLVRRGECGAGGCWRWGWKEGWEESDGRGCSTDMSVLILRAGYLLFHFVLGVGGRGDFWSERERGGGFFKGSALWRP